MSSSPQFATAQLISPGILSDAHADFRSMLSCTKCHDLGKRGASKDKCLSCHVPVRNRLQEQKGLHARFAEENCGECHKEHFGADFDVLQFDTTAFDHDSTGFELGEGHGELDCGECHQSQFIVAPDVREFFDEHDTEGVTFLGVGAACMTCHEDDDPHAEQFRGQKCEECHDDEAWEDLAGFDHDQTRFRLIGKHREVECDDCHKPIRRRGAEPYVQYVNMTFRNCVDCHEDEHDGERGQACNECHNTRGFHRINRAAVEERFDHETTDFQLVGAHAEAECTSCHGPRPKRDDEVYISFVAETRDRTFAHPVADDCLSCHRDLHEEEFTEAPGGAVCENCHGQAEWSPAKYDIERHNRDAEFELKGAHVATPCIACHEIEEGDERVATWHFEAHDCASCHDDDAPHEQQFPDAACDDCHDPDAFTISAFDHDDTRYPLDGLHRDVPCADCHPEETSDSQKNFVRYKPLDMECRDCHGGN